MADGIDWAKDRFLITGGAGFLGSFVCGAHRVLGWRPRTSFKELVRIMVDADLREYGIFLDAAESQPAAEACAAAGRA